MPDASHTQPGRRLLLLHAHPDDETINNGATMAKYVAERAAVTLVTCTLGEMGEVVVPDLEHLAHERQGGLGEHRIGELAAAMDELGVTDHRFLGGPGRFHDSGMAWGEDGGATLAADVHEGAFWHADLKAAADELVAVIRETRPQVLVTYDEYGGYGHPDHVQAHRVATYAVSLSGARAYRTDLGRPWAVAKVYWASMSESRMRDVLRALRAAGDTSTFEGMEPDGPLGRWVTADELIDAAIDGSAFVDAKMAALRAHRTQVTMEHGFFALSESVGDQMWSHEFYRLAQGARGPVDPVTGRESDLFAGLD